MTPNYLIQNQFDPAGSFMTGRRYRNELNQMKAEELQNKQNILLMDAYQRMAPALGSIDQMAQTDPMGAQQVRSQMLDANLLPISPKYQEQRLFGTVDPEQQRKRAYMEGMDRIGPSLPSIAAMSDPNDRRSAYVATMSQVAPYNDEVMKSLNEYMLPKPTEQPSAVKEYEYARQQGYKGTFNDFQLSSKKAGATNISTTVGQPTIGTIPQGFAAKQLPDGSWTMEPVQGGPAAREIKEQEKKEALRQQQKSTSNDIISADIDKIINSVEKSKIPLTGLGSLASFMPGTPQHDIASTLETIGGNISFESLNAMRQASPTGGALGSVTEKELALLKSTMGSLKQSQSEKQFLDNLKRLKQVYSSVVHGKAKIENNSSPQQAPAAGGWGIRKLP